MRNRFGSWLNQKLQKRKDIYLLSGDIGFGIFDELQRDNPKHFVNCGIAEQNMIGVSAGLAAQGLTPFVYTIIPFLMYRPFEFIRNLIAHQNLKVILVGVGGGFAYDNLGFTHYAKEDLILASTLPNFRIFTPYDAQSAEYCFEAALNASTPSYIRLMKGGEETLPRRVSSHNGAELIREYGKDFYVICHGGISLEVMHAVDALKELGLRGNQIAVWDHKQVFKVLEKISGPIFFVEEQVAPGLFQSTLMQEGLVNSNNLIPDIYFLGISKNIENKLAPRSEILIEHRLDTESLIYEIKSKLFRKDN